MSKNFFRLKVEFENPNADRRFKSDASCWKTWRKGSVWRHMPAVPPEIEKNKYGEPERIKLVNHGLIIMNIGDSKQLFQDLMDNMEPFVPLETCSDESAADKRDSFLTVKEELNFNSEGDILRQLYYSGKISLSDVKQAMNEISSLDDDVFDHAFCVT